MPPNSKFEFNQYMICRLSTGQIETIHRNMLRIVSEVGMKIESDPMLEKLADFGIKGRVVEVCPGPVITVYEYEPAPGIKINRITALADDLALGLKAASVRIVGPLPGKSVLPLRISSNQLRWRFTASRRRSVEEAIRSTRHSTKGPLLELNLEENGLVLLNRDVQRCLAPQQSAGSS